MVGKLRALGGNGPGDGASMLLWSVLHFSISLSSSRNNSHHISQLNHPTPISSLSLTATLNLHKMACLYNSHLALRRVFLSPPTPDLSTTTTTHLRHLVPSLLPSPAASRRFFTGIRRTGRETTEPGRLEPHKGSFMRQIPPLPENANPRHLHARNEPPARPPASKYGPKKNKKQSANRLPRDEEISRIADYVLLRGEDGRLSEPKAVSTVLFECGVADRTLTVIALPKQRDEGGGGPRYPICAVVDRAEFEEAERVREESGRERETEEKKVRKGTKELEMNWMIQDHDLGVKMRKMREFLGKGLRVEVLLARKTRSGPRGRGKMEVKREVAEELVRKVKEVAGEAGAKEYKVSDGSVGGRFQMFFEGVSGGKKKSGGEVAEGV